MTLMGRLTSVIATPSEAFDDVTHSPPTSANWLFPAVLLIVVSWIGLAVVFSQPSMTQQLREKTEQAIEKQLAKQHLPPEKAQQSRQMAETIGFLATKLIIALQPVFVAFASPIIWGFFLWLVGARAFKGGFSYLKAVEAVGLGNMVLVIGAVVRTLVALVVDSVYAGPNLALLLGKDFDPQDPTHLMLANLDAITFWVLGVRSIALARLAKVSLARAGACVLGIWFAYSAFFFGLSALAKAASRAMTGG